MYSNTKGAACENCDTGRYRQSKAADGVTTTDPKTCVNCPTGYTSDKGSTRCNACGAGRYGGILGCTNCALGYSRNGSDPVVTSCRRCKLGETTTLTGASTCEKCDLGKAGSIPGTCESCQFGQYQDGKGTIQCKKCGIDTYSSAIGKSSKADCIRCEKDRSTGSKIGNTNADACKCKRTEFYTGSPSSDSKDSAEISPCLECPLGADCSERDGLLIHELSALSGYWRPAPTSKIFLSCSEGYRNHIDSIGIGTERCCPFDILSNQSICKSLNATTEGTDSDKQCKLGYSGPMCLVCATNYVNNGGKCVICSSSFFLGFLPSLFGSFFLFIFVLFALLCFRGSIKKSRLMRTKSQAQLKKMRRLRRVHKVIGSIKILLSFLQILASLPNILDVVVFPPMFLKITLPLAVFNFDFVTLLSEQSCGMSVPFYDRFIIHMMLPVLCTFAVAAAYLIARGCTHGHKKEKHTHIVETTSKIVILVVLLLYPGISTKCFQMFKCQKFIGIPGTLLVQDFAITCHRGDHVTYTVLAITFVVIYICGIPLSMFVLLWRNRKHLHDKDSPKNHWVETALGGLYIQYEPKYWWFELMSLLNKTIMCGALVVLAPGSPVQILFAVLTMLTHLLFLLKLAPYVEVSEDWSSFLLTLGLMLMSLGAYSMMLELEEKERMMIEIATTAVPLLCILTVLGIAIFVDCGLYNRLYGKNKKRKKNEQILSNMSKQQQQKVKNWTSTQVIPMSEVEESEKN